jgi:hypothetical protein
MARFLIYNIAGSSEKIKPTGDAYLFGRFSV